MSSYTGVRFSDIRNISNENFYWVKRKPYFKFRAYKTGEEVQIPAHSLVLEILKKYDWKLPSISNQKYNVHLKEIIKMAGIDQPITVTSYPGGKRVDIIAPKYSLVSSHTARRNLICNMFTAGVAVETIKKISGHRSHDAFMAYLRLTPEDHLNLAFKSKFFNALPNISVTDITAKLP